MNTPLSDKAKQSYIKSPVHCPYCNSLLLDSDPVESSADANKAYANVKCNACGKSWADEYTLTGITEVTDE